MASCGACNTEVQPGIRWCPICHSNLLKPAIGRLASPGRRLGAHFMDLVIPLAALFVTLGLFGVGLLAGSAASKDAGGALGCFVIAAFVIGYSVWALRLFAQGQTPGKRVVGMTVVKENGESAGFGTMLFRETIGKFLSGIVFGLGYLWILFDKDRQAWHDKLASTFVVESSHSRVLVGAIADSQPPAPQVFTRVPAGVARLAKLWPFGALVLLLVLAAVFALRVSTRRSRDTGIVAAPTSATPGQVALDEPRSMAQAQQVTFDFVGHPETWTVPDNLTSIQVDARGAQGGGNGSNPRAQGGKGGRVQTTIAVTPGETLVVYVGGRGGDLSGPNNAGPGGFNGGGSGGTDNVDFNGPGGGGGGASDVRQHGNGLANRVVVAGGGGGAECCEDANGGDGGGKTAISGATSGGSSVPGGGGTLSTGGVGGGGCNGSGGPGGLGQGGVGGNGNRSGGGGGGGYYGGGGGGGCVFGSGGGGGSSFAGGINTIHTPGDQTGAGQVVITASRGTIKANANPGRKPAATFIDEMDGTTMGSTHGITFERGVRGSAARFTRTAESRIQYPTGIPEEGTLEWWLNISDGYFYANFALTPHADHALLFATDSHGGDVTWPGAAKLFLWRDGKITFDMATAKGDQGPHQTIETHTQFRFGEWHALGVSFGSKGQYIMLDGRLVASEPDHAQWLGRGGTHNAQNDIPTIGQAVSGHWARNQYDGGFEGLVNRFRASPVQRDWVLAKESLPARLQMSTPQESTVSAVAPNARSVDTVIPSSSPGGELPKPPLKSAFGKIPGSWKLNDKGFRDIFVPKPGYGNGVFAVPLGSTKVVALDLESRAFSECERLPARSEGPAIIESSDTDPPAVSHPYRCRTQLSGSEALFIESDTLPTASEGLTWRDSAEPSPPITLPTQTERSDARAFFVEQSTSPALLRGKRLFHGAWVRRFAVKAQYDENYGKTVVRPRYQVLNRAIYERGTDGLRIWLADDSIEDSDRMSLGLAFLPPKSSDFFKGGLSYLYAIPSGFWIRADMWRDHEGAGAWEQIEVLELRNGNWRLVTSATRLRMY